MSITINFRWLMPEGQRDLQLPSYETSGSAGMDIAACIDGDVTIEPGDMALIPTGFAMAIPEGYEVQVRPRSGLAIKHGITLINSPGTIDSDYRGEVKVGLINHGKTAVTFKRGDRIAQMIVAPVIQASFTVVEVLDDTERGDGGFGSTGVG